MSSFRLGAEEHAGAGAVVEQVLPTLRDLDGFRGLVVLSELEGDEVISLSLWDSAADMDDALKVTDKIRDAETASRDAETGARSTYRVVAFEVGGRQPS